MVSKSKTGMATWTGRILSLLAVLPFCLSAFMKFAGTAQFVQGWAHFGWPDTMVIPIATIEAACVLLYLVPQVSVLGAILLTGFLGGAVATHLRIGEAVYLHVILGFFIWGGLYLREPRLRELVPIRKG